IDLTDTSSPLEILRQAQTDWESGSGGLMTLVLQQATSKTGNDMIVVHAHHIPSSRTGALFSVVHRPNNFYPVTIVPTENDLPNFLKKSYYEPGYNMMAEFAKTTMGNVPGSTVENEWVAETPGEFRSQLRKAFKLGTVKSILLNLSSTNDSSKNANEVKVVGNPAQSDPE
ncbi:MAG: hypothetical protein ACK5T6_16745, partial [Pirellula sp.]